jgi:hypothetical protein
MVIGSLGRQFAGVAEFSTGLALSYKPEHTIYAVYLSLCLSSFSLSLMFIDRSKREVKAKEDGFIMRNTKEFIK